MNETVLPQPVQTVQVPVPVQALQYAMPETLGSVDARAAFRMQLIVAILSGLCVGSCFLSLSENVAAFGLQIILFAVTIVLAIRGGILLTKLAPIAGDTGSMIRVLLDLLATAGLAIVGVAPMVYGIDKAFSERIGAGALGLAAILLAGTTSRHVMLYRLLANICRQINRTGMARQLIVLGWFKAIYEFIWLGCCAVALMFIAAKDTLAGSDAEGVAFFCAFAALFGAMGFGAIWIWMMVAHALLLRLAKTK